MRNLRPPEIPEDRQVVAEALIDWCRRTLADIDAAKVAPVPWETRERLRVIWGIVHKLVPEQFTSEPDESEDC